MIRSSEEWREIVADFEREGGAAVDYCARRGLGAQTLLRWRRRLAREAEAVPAFVSLGPAPMDSLAWDAELDLGGGHGSPSAEAELLTSVPEGGHLARDRSGRHAQVVRRPRRAAGSGASASSRGCSRFPPAPGASPFRSRGPISRLCWTASTSPPSAAASATRGRESPGREKNPNFS